MINPSPIWEIEFKIYGAIKLDTDLNRRRTSAIKAVSKDSIKFTEITLREAPNERHKRSGYFSAILTLQAETRRDSLRIGRVYAGQLCDLLSYITKVAVYYEITDDGEDRISPRGTSSSLASYRLLLAKEWDWILECNPWLRANEPRFVAACSWYRRALCCDDITEQLCCYWRVIEGCADSYARAFSSVPDDLKSWKNLPIKQKINIFIENFVDHPNGLLADEDERSRVYRLRNIISHGEEPLSHKLIESCSNYVDACGEAAHTSLESVISEVSKHNTVLFFDKAEFASESNQ
ncbi:MAG: hypothetical protein SNJ68_00085 [Cyanobacteriota bacterium]